MSSCKNCGNCCANILMLSKEEVSNIKGYITKNNIELINRNHVGLKEDVNICPFLSKDNRCNIYEVRPSICRSYNCNKKESNIMNYSGVKAINMLLTFGNNEFSIKSPDLEELNNRIVELQKKMNIERW